MGQRRCEAKVIFPTAKMLWELWLAQSKHSWLTEKARVLSVSFCLPSEALSPFIPPRPFSSPTSLGIPLSSVSVRKLGSSLPDPRWLRLVDLSHSLLEVLLWSPLSHKKDLILGKLDGHWQKPQHQPPRCTQHQPLGQPHRDGHSQQPQQHTRRPGHSSAQPPHHAGHALAGLHPLPVQEKVRESPILRGHKQEDLKLYRLYRGLRLRASQPQAMLTSPSSPAPTCTHVCGRPCLTVPCPSRCSPSPSSAPMASGKLKVSWDRRKGWEWDGFAPWELGQACPILQ